MIITAKELVSQTGATYRQIDHWSKGGILPFTETGVGSGYKRLFEEEIVDKVKLLVRVSEAFDGSIKARMLKWIYEAFDERQIELDTGVFLRWKEADEI